VCFDVSLEVTSSGVGRFFFLKAAEGEGGTSDIRKFKRGIESPDGKAPVLHLRSLCPGAGIKA